jgi:hypothetical protein
MCKNSRNNTAIIIGIISIVVFIIASRITYSLQEIRIKGELVYIPIVSISYASKGGNSAKVLIDGEELSAGNISNKLRVGDTIAVRYIKGKPRVVQERIELWRFYLWFGLESIFLILGIPLIIRGLCGKTIFKPNKFTDNKKRNKKK